jgi:hypothetical protein
MSTAGELHCLKLHRLHSVMAGSKTTWTFDRTRDRDAWNGIFSLSSICAHALKCYLRPCHSALLKAPRLLNSAPSLLLVVEITVLTLKLPSPSTSHKLVTFSSLPYLHCPRDRSLGCARLVLLSSYASVSLRLHHHGVACPNCRIFLLCIPL